MTPLTVKQQELADLMSDISEEEYFAGWLSGLEYSLWYRVIDTDNMDDEVIALRKLSEEIGGWIIWWDDSNDESLIDKPDEWGNVFVPMAEWIQMYADYHLTNG